MPLNQRDLSIKSIFLLKYVKSAGFTVVDETFCLLKQTFLPISTTHFSLKFWNSFFIVPSPASETLEQVK